MWLQDVVVARRDGGRHCRTQGVDMLSLCFCKVEVDPESGGFLVCEDGMLERSSFLDHDDVQGCMCLMGGL